MPEWLTTGITYLLPKSKNTMDPKNYRPITCLSTMYKMLTGIIARRISLYLEEHNLLPEEQKGCHPGSKGCKDQLLISKAILEDCRRRKKNLNMAWIDYQKAFDRVPHSWIEKSMELVGVNDRIVKFCKHSMEKWNTKLQLRTNQELMQSQPIKINRGIFQGDSLSPLLFCIALTPLTHELNRSGCGYQVHGSERKIGHLLYMDDLKLLGKSEEELRDEIKIVKTFSSDIKMEFGLEKCARISIKKGKVQRKEHVENTGENEINELETNGAYKYLGIEENHQIEHKKEKERLKKEYVRRLRLILNTELNAKNKMQAIGSLAVPVLRYSFGIINWHKEEIQKLDRKTRKMLTTYGQHHPRADIDRLYVPRKEGGRGLIQIEAAYVAETTNLAEYIEGTEDQLMKIVRTHQRNTSSSPNTACKHTEFLQKKAIAENTKEKWEKKRMHGQYPRSLDDTLVDKEQTYRWLKFGGIKGETESLIVAAQDQAISTNYFKRKILKEEIGSKCRLCKEYEETIDHLTSGCPVLAKNEYIVRHDKVCMHLHYSICKEFGIEVPDNWYSHVPKSVCEHEDITVLWNQGVQTDREVLANRPDIIIKNKQKKTCILIDVSVPSDRNVVQKEAEKKLKYKNLSIEIQRMWNMKCFVIPVIIGATGTVTRGLRKYLELIPGKHSIDSLQKTAILGTSHILRKVLQCEA